MHRGFGIRRGREGISWPLDGVFGSIVSASELELDSDESMSESELDLNSLLDPSTTSTSLGGARVEGRGRGLAVGLGDSYWKIRCTPTPVALGFPVTYCRPPCASTMSLTLLSTLL
jgi:hypothetical protein